MSISFKQINIHLDKAKKMLEMGEVRFALTSCRNSLELLVKQMCSHSGIAFDTSEATIETMIDQLFISNITTDYEKDLMHRVRMASNKGAHIDINNSEIHMDSVIECINDLEKLIDSVKENYSSETMKRASATNNVPMQNPDYLSPGRKYYGKWSHCKTKESLLVIPEYVELQKKAIEDGDVEAMLNIAIGFLSKEIEWNDNMLINMPGVMYRGKYYTQDNAYDSRYYYWVQEAVFTACKKWHNGEYFPRKYIATAIWEFFLFWFYASLKSCDCNSPLYWMKTDSNIIGLNHYVTEVTDHYDSEKKEYIYDKHYESQYNFFDPYYNSESRILDEGVLQFAKHIFKDYPGSIIAPVYTNATNPFEQICFMYDCIKCCWSAEDEDVGIGYYLYNDKQIEDLKNRLDTLKIDCSVLPFEEGKRMDIMDYEIFKKGGSFFATIYNESKRRVDYSREAVKNEKREIENAKNWKKAKRNIAVFMVAAALLLVLFGIPARQKALQQRQVPDMLQNPERVADFREKLIDENVIEDPVDKKNDTWHELVGVYYVSNPNGQTIDNSEVRFYYIVHNDPYSEYDYNSGEYALNYMCYIGKENDKDQIYFDRADSWVAVDRIEIMESKAEKGEIVLIDMTNKLRS